MAETWSLLRRAHGWLLGVGLFTYAGTLIRGPVAPLRRADLADCVDVRQDVACSTIFDLRTRNRPCATRNNIGTTVVANHKTRRCACAGSHGLHLRAGRRRRCRRNHIRKRSGASRWAGGRVGGRRPQRAFKNAPPPAAVSAPQRIAPCRKGRARATVRLCVCVCPTVDSFGSLTARRTQ